MSETNAATSYEASHIHVLHGVDAMRKRPGMYIGSTGVRGLHHMVYETVDRSVHEVLAGHADSIDVTVTADGAVRITDNGCGIPVAVDGSTGTSYLESTLTEPYRGTRSGTRSGTGYYVSSGIHGIGMSVVNALSSRLAVEVRREGFRWSQEYERGVPVAPPIRHEATTAHGTTVTFLADADIFETTHYSGSTLWQRFQELAHLIPGLSISFTDERTGDDEAGQTAVRQVCRGDLRDFVSLLNSQEGERGLAGVIRFKEEDPGRMISVEVATQWNTSAQDRVRSFTNTRPTYEGGTHEQGFLTALAALVDIRAREMRLLPEHGEALSGDDVRAGLTAIVSVMHHDPRFEGATRSRLANADVYTYVEKAVRVHLTDWLDTNPEEADVILRHAVATALARKASDRDDAPARRGSACHRSLPGD